MADSSFVADVSNRPSHSVTGRKPFINQGFTTVERENTRDYKGICELLPASEMPEKPISATSPSYSWSRLMILNTTVPSITKGTL